jgi:hypothetical protein
VVWAERIADILFSHFGLYTQTSPHPRPSACHWPALRLSAPGLGYQQQTALVLRALRITPLVTHTPA